MIIKHTDCNKRWMFSILNEIAFIPTFGIMFGDSWYPKGISFLWLCFGFRVRFGGK